MTFLDMRKRVAELAGLDQTQTATDTRLKEWINQAYQEVSSFYDWPWLVKRGIIQTQPNITTGTVSVTQDSASITFSSAPSISVANQFMFQTGDSESWYNIASHTAASPSATLDVPYLDATNGSATYKLQKVAYSLPSDLDRIQFIRQTEDDTLLVEFLPRDYFNAVPDPSSESSPRFYYFRGLDTSQNWQVGLHPIPEAKINLLVGYYQTITELSGDSDEPLIPNKYHNVLVFGALALYGYTFVDDTRVQEAQRVFVRLLDEMKRQANPGKDSHTVIQPWDLRPGVSRRGPGFFRLPSKFGPNFHF